MGSASRVGQTSSPVGEVLLAEVLKGVRVLPSGRKLQPLIRSVEQLGGTVASLLDGKVCLLSSGSFPLP